MINVADYIENEKYYLENYGLECDKQDIKFLESLTNEDIEKIQNLVETDSELSNDIDNLVREAINYWVYHYKKESK